LLTWQLRNFPRLTRTSLQFVFVNFPARSRGGAFLGQDVRNNMQILANVFNVDVSPATIVPFTLSSTTTSSLQALISNNLIRSVNGGAVDNGAAIGDLNGVNQFVSTGNIWTGLASLANNTMVRLRTGSLTTINHAALTGEMIVADSPGTQTSALRAWRLLTRTTSRTPSSTTATSATRRGRAVLSSSTKAAAPSLRTISTRVTTYSSAARLHRSSCRQVTRALRFLDRRGPGRS
jgi:hypothetical protein